VPKQKKRTAFTQSSSSLVGRDRLELSTKGFRFVWLSPLPGLCLHRSCRLRWVPSSLYTFKVLSHWASLGIALCVATLRFHRLWHHPLHSFHV